MNRPISFPFVKWRTLLSALIFFCFLLYFSAFWLIKLDVLPGLHGDEAWFGLAAADTVSNSTELSPMNNYTGVFQPLISALVFKSYGVGVFQLRFPGFVFNILGVIIIFWFLKDSIFRIPALILLSFLAQSALFLISPRVAWEVNTFTFFLVTILAFCHLKFYRSLEIRHRFWNVLFWITNIIGSYNHIIFSCISVASFIGVLLWSLTYKDMKYKNLLALTAINILNLSALFLVMHFGGGVLISTHLLVALLCILILLNLEHSILSPFLISKIDLMNFIFLRPIHVILLFTIGATFFCYFHGLASFYVLSNYMVILHAYSYQADKVILIIQGVCGGVILIYFMLALIRDLKSKEGSLFPFIILSYIGIFSVYTTQCSFRYYLSLLFIFAIYMSIRLTSTNTKPWQVTLLVSFLINIYSLKQVFYEDNRSVKSFSFETGSDEKETSAHFLVNKPVINFLKNNQIGKIEFSDKDRYFLDLPIQFYYKVKPWKIDTNNSAIIDYDYINFGTGYVLLKK